MVRQDLDKEIRETDRSTLYKNLFGDHLSKVRKSLMISSLGSQPPEKWMTIPDMGYLIVNQYNVVLVILGNLCMTFFLMTSPLPPSVSIFCIGFANKDHKVQVIKYYVKFITYVDININVCVIFLIMQK